MDSMEVPGELHIVKKAPSALTAHLRIAIMQIKGTPRKAAGPSNSINWTDKRPPRNRHLPEWRFLLFTIIVTVKAPICNVIRIRPHLLSEDVASHLSAAQRSRSFFEEQEHFIIRRRVCQIRSSKKERRGAGPRREKSAV